MKATVLIDNQAADGLHGEWGLSVLLEYNDRKILLDTGTTGAFAQNADALGLDIGAVDFGVLSHAHYDHADGLRTFFMRNHTAPFFLREGTAEDCYSRQGRLPHYIGIRKGTLRTWRNRIRYVSGSFSPCPGMWLLPHTEAGLAEVGRAAGMYRRSGLRMRADDFAHEQSLVLDTERGLVIFNSCSHGGADRIVREAAAALPGRKPYALIGGFHLFRSSDEEVCALAERLRETGIERIVTGHCTGERAFGILREQLGERVTQFYVGCQIEC